MPPNRIILILALGALALPAAVSSLHADTSARPSIAVADFTCDRPTHWTLGLPDMLTEALVNSGQFDVFERAKLKAIMLEQGWQASGFVDPQTSVSLGNMAGVRYLLTGKIIDFGSETRAFRGYGVNTKTTFHRLKAAVKIVNVQSGRLVLAKTEDAEEKTAESQGLGITDTTVGTRLAGQIAEKLTSTLLADSLKGAEDAKPVLIPLKITSSPAQADIEVDGVFYGNAGSELNLPAGMHVITISLPGHEPWTKKVLVREGLTIHATLPLRTDLTIGVKPE